jgi:hypothetical protein
MNGWVSQRYQELMLAAMLAELFLLLILVLLEGYLVFK